MTSWGVDTMIYIMELPHIEPVLRATIVGKFWTFQQEHVRIPSVLYPEKPKLARVSASVRRHIIDTACAIYLAVPHKVQNDLTSQLTIQTTLQKEKITR